MAALAACVAAAGKAVAAPNPTAWRKVRRFVVIFNLLFGVEVITP